MECLLKSFIKPLLVFLPDTLAVGSLEEQLYRLGEYGRDAFPDHDVVSILDDVLPLHALFFKKDHGLNEDTNDRRVGDCIEGVQQEGEDKLFLGPGHYVC